MKTPTLLLTAALYAVAGPAQAAAFIVKDLTVDWYNDETFVQTPGQAYSQIAVLGNVLGDTLPGSSASTSNCLIFPVPPPSRCSGPAGVTAINLDFSPYSSGVTATGSSTGGNDFVGASVTASSTGSSVSGPIPLLYNMIGLDRQRLYFEVEGGELPEFLEVDVTFSVFASIDDRSNVTSGAQYQATAYTNLNILDADSFGAGPNEQGEIFSPLVASAVVSTFDPGEAAAIGITETILVRPNAEYWVSLESQATVSLLGWATFDPRDYAGLDIEVSAWGDPVFALNPDFAAANPDIAAGLTINRVMVVPGPATLPLLLTGVLGGWFLSRRQRNRSAG